jgi:hypothetical protein
MSDKKKMGRGYTSPEPPPPIEPTRFTAAEIQDLGYFFKKFLDDTPLKKWIISSGLGAAVAATLEMIRMVWLAWRYLAKF